jgi:nucleoside-diphosphate-sugar epimerase
MQPPATLIIGAAGAVGKRLCGALAARGTRVIASDRMEHLPGSLQRALGESSTTVGGVDVRDTEALKRLFIDHADERTTVWNLAAPLSVETAMDPAVAEAVTIGGMANVLEAMKEVGARRICFTDSIGSFGAEAPRRGATARWLTENPSQDPGSDYGRQKRGCRELMAEFAASTGGDPRFAVLPGVLHSEPVWGNGTTEYALDALLAASKDQPYACPVDPDVTLPMVVVDDLMRGLIALQEADEELLVEPEHGYCMPGLSFSPNELFAEIRKHKPNFEVSVELNEDMNKFSQLWPDELATAEPLRDLGYAPQFGLPEMVEEVLAAHTERNAATANAFANIDTDGSGTLTRDELELFVRKYLVRGRERGGYVYRRQDAIGAMVDNAMAELDTNDDGIVSWQTFQEFSRTNSLERLVDQWQEAARKSQPRMFKRAPRAVL